MLKNLNTLMQKYREIIVYLVLGVATTVVNFAVYYPLLNLCKFSATTSDVIAWVVAVLFAFLINKPLAFGSKDWSLRVTLPELGKFVGYRIGSGLVEILFLTVTVDVLCWNGNVMKVLISVFVIISNYIASKFFVFRKQKNPPQSF